MLVGPWVMTVERGRIDWSAIRDQIDLAAVVTALLGPAPGRRGERGRRLWWRCPFHQDANPSFCIEPGKPWWRCWGCSEHGDAAALVMKVRGVAFPEARRWLAEQAGIAPASVGSAANRPAPSMAPLPPAAGPAKAPDAAPDRSTGLSPNDALLLVETAEQRLWTPEGAGALTYLHGRGLNDETIRQARLGWTPRESLPTSDGDSILASVRDHDSLARWRPAGPAQDPPARGDPAEVCRSVPGPPGDLSLDGDDPARRDADRDRGRIRRPLAGPIPRGFGRGCDPRERLDPARGNDPAGDARMPSMVRRP